MFNVRRKWVGVLLALVAVLAVFIGYQWQAAVSRNRSGAAEPFRIAGNLYYVGGNDPAVFLVTGPEGHVLIDGGWPETAPLVMASMRTLGFDIKDVKVLLNSEPHADHSGGLAALKQASGAELWSSDASADALASGGDDPDIWLPMRALLRIGLVGFPGVGVDHRFKDGDIIRVGPIAITAHLTPGQTRGCTSYSFLVRDGERVLNVVSVCDTGVLSTVQYPEQAQDRERSIRLLRSLPADIWVTNHARPWGRYRKFVASRTAENPVDPFIDREGYRAFLDAAETELREGRVH